ncbi:MAG: AAA family ATPase [Candidatus Lokiarchaeota archaeon]
MMNYKNIFYNNLKEFNLPKIEINEEFLNDKVIPSFELLIHYTDRNDELDFENISKVMALILNRIYERAMRTRSENAIILTSAILWHSVINKNTEGIYLMQIPLSKIIKCNLSAVHSLRNELFIIERKYDNISDFKDSLMRNPPLAQIIRESLDWFNQKAKLQEIISHIKKIYNNFDENKIRENFYSFVVNKENRLVFNINQSARICFSQYDVLYSLNGENFERYRAQNHGIWEIKKDENGTLYCHQKLSPNDYEKLDRFLTGIKDNAYVKTSAIFLFFNNEKEFYTKNEIWKGIQVLLDNIRGDTPRATLTSELLRHSESAEILSKRKETFFDSKDEKETVYRLLESRRKEIENFLIKLGISTIIDMGPPGTSKSYLADQIALILTDADRDRIGFVQFHPSYTYEDFVECNMIKTGDSKESKLTVKPEEKIFRKFCKKASQEPNKKFVFIIDEINRGNVERIFGELIYSLENRNKKIKSLYFQDSYFFIPENVLIIATMNTVDQSIANIDTALRRRFYIKEIMPSTNVLEKWLETTIEDNKYKGFQELLIKFMEQINEKIESNPLMGRYRTIGHAYFMLKAIKDNWPLDGMMDHFKMEWNLSIKPTLLEYVNFSNEKLSKFEEIYQNTYNEMEKHFIIEKSSKNDEN